MGNGEGGKGGFMFYDEAMGVDVLIMWIGV